MEWLIVSLLLPLISLLIGWVYIKYTPRDINNIVGYRTKQSTRNFGTWRFANRYCGSLLWRLGLILSIISIINLIIFKLESIAISIIIIHLILLPMIIFLVEYETKKNYPS